MVFFTLECIGFMPNIIRMLVGMFRRNVEYSIQYSWLICQQSVI